MENTVLSNLLALAPLGPMNCRGDTVSCIDSLKNVLSKLFSEMGYDHYVVSDFPITANDILGADLFLAMSFDERWSTTYRQKLYDQIDPLFARSLVPSSDAYLPRGTWTDCQRLAAAHPHGETTQQKADYVTDLNAFFADAASHGYRSGVVMGHDIGDRRINLSLTSGMDPEEHDKRPDPRFWALLKLILVTVDDAIHAMENCPVCQRGVDIDISLTPAEAQWFQAILDYPNDTLEEIAKHLHRSINTGNTHIRNVKERMGITVKTVLLAQALKRSHKI